MKNWICICLLCCLSCFNENKSKQDDNPVLGEESVTFIITDLPAHHDFKTAIYVSGDFEGWSGGREQFKLKQEDSIYSITVPKYKETISFKFTRGKWGLEESQPNSNPVDNRTYTFEKLKDTLYINISNWADNNKENKPSTALENVKIFAENFEMPQLNTTRRVQIYLPPGYETSGLHYPVLYILDGQNIFDVRTSYSGEWEVDETLNKLYKETGFGLIVVAIDHGGEQRFNEYSPWDNEKYGTGKGQVFLEFLIESLKPEIDKTYRTKTDSESTAIMGSSLGGLFAHYAAITNPNVFGKAGIFSPSLWYSDESFSIRSGKESLSQSRLYYLVGTNEEKDMVSNMVKVTERLKEAYIPKERLETKIVPNGTHSETLWRSEFEETIRWLFKI